MTDPGHVSPGSDPWELKTASYTLRKISVSEMDNNVYLITCRATAAQMLVDAADDSAAIETLVETGGGAVDLVVTTHGHWDHHRALVEITNRYAPRTACGAADADDLPVPPDLTPAHGDHLEVGDLRVEVIALRGHTPGSIALAVRDDDAPAVLLTGDSLFPGGPGRTRSAGDFTSLVNDLQERLFDQFDDSTLVLPGHGDNTTLGAERPQLGLWRERGW